MKILTPAQIQTLIYKLLQDYNYTNQQVRTVERAEYSTKEEFPIVYKPAVVVSIATEEGLIKYALTMTNQVNLNEDTVGSLLIL